MYSLDKLAALGQLKKLLAEKDKLIEELEKERNWWKEAAREPVFTGENTMLCDRIEELETAKCPIMQDTIRRSDLAVKNLDLIEERSNLRARIEELKSECKRLCDNQHATLRMLNTKEGEVEDLQARYKLFDRMAESMRANAGELCTDIVCQRNKEFCGICYSCDARALLTEIDALKKGEAK